MANVSQSLPLPPSLPPESKPLPPQNQALSEEKLHTFHPLQDRFLYFVEFLIVLCLGLGTLGSLFLTCAWVFWGTGEPALQRIKTGIKFITENWQIGVILLVPLFFRPLRTFLEKIKRVGGADTLPSRGESIENPKAH